MFFAPALVLTAIAVCSPEAEAANLLKNPGFETGDFTGWRGNRSSAITTTPRFIPETIRTGNYGARIFPMEETSAPIFLFQQFTIPDAVDQLRFGGYLRFFSFEVFDDNRDWGLIGLYTMTRPAVILGTQANGLRSSPAGTSPAGNRVRQASDWLFFESVVDVAGLDGQTAFFSLIFWDLGEKQDTALAFDDLFVEVVPVPTPALLPGLVGLSLAVWRNKVGDRSV